MERNKLRFNIITLIVYLCGVILLLQLFNLQIIHGQEYREQSDTRLTRQTTLLAARGEILDRTGTALATNTVSVSLELYKTKIDDETLNTAILNMINVLEKNGDKYIDKFPIKINPFEYTITDDALKKFKNTYKINENATAEEAFYQLKNKYKITQENIEDIRKILIVRYSISENGYSSTKSIEIANGISNASINELGERSADFPGINILQKPIRNYLLGSLASHVLGYVGKIEQKELEKEEYSDYSMNDYIGKTGLEYTFEKYLRGTNGEKQIDMDVNGIATGEYITKEAIAGSNIILTIDANLQKITEDALKANIEKIKSGGFGSASNAKGGVAVVMNVKSGEILALASYPDYEPQLLVEGISSQKWNEYLANNALFNRAVQGAYAPGSIFKMVTAIAGLETGVITTTEEINDTGIYKEYKDYQPRCWIYNSRGYGHGRLNVGEAIENSCNYFFYEVCKRMGIDNLEKYGKYFKLGEKTGIELPGETSGTLASKENTKYTGDVLMSGIGQGANNFSPIQIARYISILVNGNKNIKPTLIRSIINADGTEVGTEEINQYVNEKLGITEEENDITLNSENVKAVLDGMKSVTEDGTASSVFRNFEIAVGGKTGSTESNTGDVNAWFTGVAPFEDPEIAVIVLVENGAHGYYTAEVAREIIKEYFGMNVSGVKENMLATPLTEEMR